MSDLATEHRSTQVGILSLDNGPQPEPRTALTVLSERAIGFDGDEKSWLAARAQRVTATEVARLAKTKSEKARKNLIERMIQDKQNGSKFYGNQFTDWGKLREPVILDELDRRYGIIGCGLLIPAVENALHAATPDGAGLSDGGALQLAEIKTGKTDVSYGSEAFNKTNYYSQMQWQLYCTGAERVLYSFEGHNDDWSGWDLADRESWTLETGPQAEELKVHWVERDNQTIEKLVDLADEFLSVFKKI